MESNETCIVCSKHKNLETFTGDVIAEQSGILLTHFPIIDRQPAVRGHLLIEPRKHITDLDELNLDEASAVGILTQSGSAVIKNLFGAEHAYIFRINDKVAHFHIHLVPRYPETSKEHWGLKIMEWSGQKKVSLPEIKTLAREAKHFFRKDT